MGSFFYNEQNTSLKNIFTAFRVFKDNPGIKIKTGIWYDDEWDYDKFLKWFRKSLNRKISSHLSLTGRKYLDEFQSDLNCDSFTLKFRPENYIKRHLKTKLVYNLRMKNRMKQYGMGK